jgi:hypothetical protein
MAENEELNKKIEIETVTIKKVVANKKTDVLNKLKGFFYVLFGCFFNTFQSYFMRKADFFNGAEQTVIRYFVQMIMLGIVAIYYKVSFLGPKEFRVKYFFKLNVIILYIITFI